MAAVKPVLEIPSDSWSVPTVDPKNETAVAFWEAAGFGLDVYRRWSRML